MTYSTLVSTDVLAAHRGDWAIVDCRYDLQQPSWGREQYRAGHIPGAVYASLDDLAGDRTGANGRHPLPTVDALAATVGRLGIDRSTQVVVYDQGVGMFASRLWWSLRYLGHDAVALLDGGWAKWLGEGRPVQSGDASRAPAVFTPSVRAGMRVDADAVWRLAAGKRVRLIDARGPERFEGRTEPLDRIAGHIPGAVNHYYQWNVSDDGVLLPAEVLREKFAGVLDSHPPEDAIVYCGSGVSACHNLLAMAHAGLAGAKLYVGSWSEWSSDPSRPVETGPARR